MTQCQKQSYTTLLTTVMLHVKLSLLYIYVFSVMLIKGLLIHIEHLNARPPPTWFFPNFLICGPWKQEKGAPKHLYNNSQQVRHVTHCELSTSSYTYSKTKLFAHYNTSPFQLYRHGYRFTKALTQNVVLQLFWITHFTSDYSKMAKAECITIKQYTWIISYVGINWWV